MKKTKPLEGTPQAYEIRELKPADFGKGFIETLGNLSDTEGLSLGEARGILKAMKRAGLYHTFVAVGADGKVLGATTLLVEQKFTHGGGLVGHIEDVVVRKGHDGRGIGSSVVKEAVGMAKELGCYKVILDCKEDLEAFYARLGFVKYDVGMRLDLKAQRPRKR